MYIHILYLYVFIYNKRRIVRMAYMIMAELSNSNYFHVGGRNNSVVAQSKNLHTSTSPVLVLKALKLCGQLLGLIPHWKVNKGVI